MSPAVQSAIISALAVVIVGVLTYRQTRKGNDATAKLSERVVDREDFEAVMTRTEAALERADRRITELEGKLEAEVRARQEADDRATAAERRAVAAEQRADIAEKRAIRLERRVTQLEETLRENKISVPPVPSD